MGDRPEDMRKMGFHVPFGEVKLFRQFPSRIPAPPQEVEEFLSLGGRVGHQEWYDSESQPERHPETGRRSQRTNRIMNNPLPQAERGSR